MIQTLRSIAPVFLSVVFLVGGNGLLTSFIGLQMAEAEFNSLWAGAVAGAFYAGLGAGSLLAARSLRFVGHIRSFAAYASILSTVTLGHALFVDEVFWMVLRFMAGFCWAGLMVCLESWLSSSTTSENRGGLLAAYMTCFYLAYAFGQLPLMIDPSLAAALFIGASMLLSLAVVPVTLSSRLAPALPESAFVSPRELYRLSPSGVIGALASGLVQGAFFGLGTFFAQRSGLTATEAAYFILAGVLGGLAGQLPLGRLSDYVDRRKVIGSAYLATALVALAIVYTSDLGLFALLGLTLVMGGTLFSLYALCLAHLNDYVHSGEMVGVSQSLLITFSVGAVLGPVLASSIIGVTGAGGLFIFIAGVCALTSAFVFWRMSKRDALPWKDKLDYVAFPNTTPTLSELHPAADLESGTPKEPGAAA